MNLQEKVKKVNEILVEFGSEAIQEDTTKNFKAIGYKPQYLIDAMNSVIGQGNWKHNVLDVNITDVTYSTSNNSSEKTRTAVTVKLNIQFLENREVIYETGTHVGGSFVISGNIADAIKSAITDGIGKSLSLLSIGNLAYRGKLETGENSGKITEKPTDSFTGKVSSSFSKPGKTSNNRFKPKNSTPTSTDSKGGGFKKPTKQTKELGKESVLTPTTEGNGSFSTRFSDIASENAVASFSDSGLSSESGDTVNGN